MRMIVVLFLFGASIISGQVNGDENRGSERYSISDDLKKMELFVEGIESHSDQILEMCSLNSKCCRKAESRSFLRYIRHSLAIEGIQFDKTNEATKALIEASMYVDAKLKMKNISFQRLMAIHKLMIDPINATVAGRIRQHDVAVWDPVTLVVHKMPPYDTIETSLADFIHWIKTSSAPPFMKAASVHEKLVRIHPFADGNGRTARLLYNVVLREEGYPGWVTFLKEDIEQYYHALSTKANPNEFLTYTLKAQHESLEWLLKDLLQCKDSPSVN